MHGAAPHALTGSSAGRRLDKKRLTRSAGKPGRNLFRSAFSPCVFPELRAPHTHTDSDSRQLRSKDTTAARAARLR